MIRLWALEHGPFGYGMVMCEDALYINLEYGGAFRITGQNLRVKPIKQRAPTGLEEDAIQINTK